MAATQRDQYRKPMPGMWNEVESVFRREGTEIGTHDIWSLLLIRIDRVLDKLASFFVGDAAGRKYPGGKADFSSTDRKWAENIGLRFFTPEVNSYMQLRLKSGHVSIGIFPQISTTQDFRTSGIQSFQSSTRFECFRSFSTYPELDSDYY